MAGVNPLYLVDFEGAVPVVPDAGDDGGDGDSGAGAGAGAAVAPGAGAGAGSLPASPVWAPPPPGFGYFPGFTGQRYGEDVQNKVPNFKLADFWPQNPKLWFAQAEGAFELFGECSSRRKFFRVLSVLDPGVLKQVSDLVECVPVVQPYEILKARLLSASKVSDFQRAEQVMQLPALGNRKPSMLMAEMLELCPRGWETENWFRHMFLSRLPQNIRIMLKGVPTADLRLLAEAADEIWMMFAGSGSGSGSLLSHVAQEQVELLAAVKGGSQQQQRSQQSSSSSTKDSGHSNKNVKGKKPPKFLAEHEPPESKKARLAAGICLPHWRFGSVCMKENCVKPCAWQGN